MYIPSICPYYPIVFQQINWYYDLFSIFPMIFSSNPIVFHLLSHCCHIIFVQSAFNRRGARVQAAARGARAAIHHGWKNLEDLRDPKDWRYELVP